MLLALISAVTNGIGLIWDKIILSRERVTLRVFLPVVFVFLFVFTVILVPWFGQLDLSVALLPNSLFLLFLMVVIAVAWNVLFYQSIQRETTHQHELVVMMSPLITVLLAAVFFPEEFNGTIFILALIASGALLFAKMTREHQVFTRTSYNTFLGVVLMSTETIIIRELLYVYNPVALYAVRTLILALFFTGYYRPHYNRISNKHWLMMALSSVFGVVIMLTRFFAFEQLGVIYTTLVAILAPVIVFFGSWEILHEKIRPRVIFASIVILVCVSIATVLAFGG